MSKTDSNQLRHREIKEQDHCLPYNTVQPYLFIILLDSQVTFGLKFTYACVEGLAV